MGDSVTPGFPTKATLENQKITEDQKKTYFRKKHQLKTFKVLFNSPENLSTENDPTL